VPTEDSDGLLFETVKTVSAVPIRTLISVPASTFRTPFVAPSVPATRLSSVDTILVRAFSTSLLSDTPNRIWACLLDIRDVTNSRPVKLSRITRTGTMLSFPSDVLWVVSSLVTSMPKSTLDEVSLEMTGKGIY
jgi:hypothetical protein